MAATVRAVTDRSTHHHIPMFVGRHAYCVLDTTNKVTYVFVMANSAAQRDVSPDSAEGAGGGGAFEYVFPAIRGVQAQREFYVTMCPLRLIPRLFLFDDEELQPAVRAQRTLNRARVPDIANYILSNPGGYVFSALTASIDAEVRFAPLPADGPQGRIGLLTIPMEARFVINDGQHRRAAIEQALRENPELGDESIAIVLFLDIGLERCQQMFADLNRYVVRPSRSLNVLYDHRDSLSEVARTIVFGSPMWQELVELERSNLSARSRKLFTLSALQTATKYLLDGIDELSTDQAIELASQYWQRVANQFIEWRQVHDRTVSAGDVRRDFIHCHGIALHALGKVGNTLLRRSREPDDWDQELRLLRSIDWARSNTEIWEGRAMSAGKVSMSGRNVLLTSSVIRHAMGLELSPDELHVEEARKKRSGA